MSPLAGRSRRHVKRRKPKSPWRVAGCAFSNLAAEAGSGSRALRGLSIEKLSAHRWQYLRSVLRVDVRIERLASRGQIPRFIEDL